MRAAGGFAPALHPVRRQLALDFGATDVCEPTLSDLLYLEPQGFEYVFESVGLTPVMELAVKAAARGGTATIIGAAKPGQTFAVDALDFVPSQRRILGCLTGNVRPDLDFNRCRSHQGIRTVVPVTPE